ncbi:excinuclease ABC subunit A [Candidatus Marinamargulisbacteria bacterium SCGC AAA071-K20]|nr:excinuclease ABC subunit A [Candidatus Marinamargulisbacteria bacterium SCGC AAA071-K20]
MLINILTNYAWTCSALLEKSNSKNFESISDSARRKLLMINAAISVDILRLPPSNRLEALKGDRKGQYSIRVNQQFRVCFTWKDGHAYNVHIVDYH